VQINNKKDWINTDLQAIYIQKKLLKN